ncbi:UNVERIFIED_CONTAM: NineTeen Complex (NTC) component, partial [Siphonaria sp. JEL0065]
FEKQFCGREGIEDVMVKYEEEVAQNSRDYDVWFDYLRLEESAGDFERIWDVYERAIAEDMDRTKQIYTQCLNLIPHKMYHEGSGDVVKEVRIKSQNAKGDIKSLRLLCAVAVAGLIDYVESLENIPWNLAKQIYDCIETPSPSAVALFAKDFPVEFGSNNSHLCYRDYKLCQPFIDHLRDGCFGFFLKALDLSGSDFNDDLCASVSRLEMLELLDLSSTEISNVGLRSLCRTMVHSEKDKTTGLPRNGLKNLSFLNISMCANLTAQDLDEILSRFPSLLVIGLSRTYVERKGVVTKLKEKFGWVEAPKRVNFFPGFRGGVSSLEFDIENRDGGNSSTAETKSPCALVTSPTTEGVQSVQSSKFFGTLLKATSRNLKQQRDDYFRCRAFKLDHEISKWTRQSMDPEYKSVLDSAWSLLQHQPPSNTHPMDFYSSHDINTQPDREPIDLPEFNDLYESIIGRSQLRKHRTMNPWYLPFNATTNENKSSTDTLVSEIVESEIHGRLCLMRSEARRDLELNKVVDALNVASAKRKLALMENNGKVNEMVKKCAKRLEPAPKTVTFKGCGQKGKDVSGCGSVGGMVGHLADFDAFLNLEKSFTGSPVETNRGLGATKAQSTLAPGKSGLFKLLSKK